MVAEDQPVHRCPSLTREDEIAAMRTIATDAPSPELGRLNLEGLVFWGEAS